MSLFERLGFPGIALCLLALLAGAGIGALYMWVRMRLGLRDTIDAARRQSVAQSRATLKGQIGEQLAPLLPGFNYEPSDARFLGDPIDYVIFNGYTQVKEQGDGKVELVIVDIKRGRARLSASQQAVAEAVRARRVRFEVIRIADDGSIERET